MLKKREYNGLKNLKDPKAYPNNIQDVYKNMKEYNPETKIKALIVFHDMITDMISNKKNYSNSN